MNQSGLHLLYLSSVVMLMALVPFVLDDAYGSELADSPWPMFQGDPQHTGRSDYALDPGSFEDTTLLDTSSHNLPRISGNTMGLVIGGDGTLYLGGNEPRGLFAVDPNGGLKWYLEFPDDGPHVSIPAIDDEGNIYVGSRTGLIAIDEGGWILWTFETDGMVESSPVIGQNGLIYFGSENGTFYSVHSDGAQEWNLSVEGYRSCSPALDHNGNIVISFEYTLMSLSPSGEILWRHEFEERTLDAPVSISDDGKIILLHHLANRIYCYDSNGSKLWDLPQPLDGDATVRTAAIDEDGTVYSGTHDGVCAIRSNGKLKWTIDLGFECHSPVISRDGSILVFGNGNLYVVDSEGHLKWHYRSEWYSWIGPVIDSEGRVLYADDSGLHAISGEPFDLFALWFNHASIIMASIILIVILIVIAFRARKIKTKDTNDGPD